jgi:predicted Zn finger-like uncharacterized protein
MIIQCEQCQTKFKLDDSKVADKSIKVRCARCRHVFSVSGTQGIPEDSTAFTQNVPEYRPEEDSSDRSSLLDSFSFAADDEQAAPEPSAPAGDDSLFSLPSTASAVGHDQAETHKTDGEMDFGAFDFGDAAESADATPVMDFEEKPVKKETAARKSKEAVGGLDFSGDDMFGDVVSTSAEEEKAESISFDMGVDGFADSMGIEGGAAGHGTALASQDSAAENPFSLDDIDFGDELTSVAVRQVSTDELKPSQELLFAPLAAAQTKPALDSGADIFEKTAAPAPAQEELPPLSITSRRKETPRISGMLVFMGVIIAGLVIFYAVWGYMTLTEDKGQITTQEAGRITVRSVEASFVKNKKTGDLLVISGEAVNEYSKPRAAIQIKGIVFGANGEEVASKIAFCGNPLSREQLSTMTMEKIEAAMANQFGDSLANMEVAPGDAIQFVIVIPKPPAGATDYGVEPVGSTVATGKGE